MLILSRTRAFRAFQRKVGDSTCHINATFIGTELIARGQTKPPDLRIRWAEPKNRRDFIAQTRSYIHAAFLGHVFTALDHYLRDLASLHVWHFEENQRKYLSKAVTLPGGRELSIGDRFDCLGFSRTPDPDRALVELISIWRNQQIHKFGDDSKSRISKQLETRLVGSGQFFHKEYGDLDITSTISHCKTNQSPSRKDSVALASAAQNYVRYIDEKIIMQNLTNDTAYRELAYRELTDALGPTTDTRWRLLWGKDISARKRKIKAILEEAGFRVEATSQIGLPQDFCGDLAERELSDIQTVIEI